MFHACVIDDDPQTVTALRTSLNRLGCDVVVSEATEESFLEGNGGSKIDVAFVSLSLRKVGARRMAQMIQTRYPHSKVILITGWKGVLDSNTLLKEGFAGVLRRPPRFSEIKKVLIDHLG
jgi:DNA-binding NtrC family response regulator